MADIFEIYLISKLNTNSPRGVMYARDGAIAVRTGEENANSSPRMILVKAQQQLGPSGFSAFSSSPFNTYAPLSHGHPHCQALPPYPFSTMAVRTMARQS